MSRIEFEALLDDPVLQGVKRDYSHPPALLQVLDGQTDELTKPAQFLVHRNP